MTTAPPAKDTAMPNCTIRHPLAAAGGLAVALVLVACGNSTGSSGRAAPTSRGSTSPAAAARPDRGPAASGTVAAIAGHVMQVQNQQSGQVAVKWTTATAFSHEVSVSAAEVVVGSCVLATATTGSGSSFTASRVVLSPASSGQCGGGAFPGGGNRPANGPSGGPPSGFPGGGPSGATRPRNLRPGAGGAFAAGKVTARAGDTLTVTMRSFGSAAPATRTVKLAASTKVYEQARTTAKSLAVGRCVTAQGKADSSGTVTATRVQISSPTNGSCTTGFTRVGRGG
jgi:hypothetical protein